MGEGRWYKKKDKLIGYFKTSDLKCRYNDNGRKRTDANDILKGAWSDDNSEASNFG